MKKTKSLLTKDKIKRVAIELFNTKDTLSVTTNHIAKEANISTGNLYYHYKNKEEIIRDIYQDMSLMFDSFNSFETIMQSDDILGSIDKMFDNYSMMFYEYRFLLRDSAILMALDRELKEMFNHNQAKRIKQIEMLLEFLIAERIIKEIPKDEINLKARLHWFVSAYWQIFASIENEITKESIKEAKDVVFKMLIKPYLL
jgi:AcrR family transcriptional regulator